MKLTILADNDYYSQPKSSMPLPRFNNLDIPIFEAHKTGLGSSAALVTSLTACLLSTYSKDGTSLDFTESNKKLVHNLAQASHCSAQGKIGSGFDIAAAVFGSCVYQRFSPDILKPLQCSEKEEYNPNDFAPKLAQIALSEWDFTISKIRLPLGIRLVIGDVDCGSSTPGMVRHMLAWRNAQGSEADNIWEEVDEENEGVVFLFQELSLIAEEAPEDYARTLHTLAETKKGFTPQQASKMPAALTLGQLRNRIISIRKKMREMGETAGVPIEPPSQMKLLDYLTTECPGVLGGVVPGAGGYDAVALLVADNEQVVDGIKEKLKSYKFEGEEGVEGGGGRVEILGAREEHEGVRFENLEQYGL